MTADLSYSTNGEIDTSMHLCVPEKSFFEKNPVMLTLEHLNPTFSRRSLKFHEFEQTTDVSKIKILAKAN